ncbi:MULTISPECIES: uridine kinase [Acidobacterium]|uniref:uridine/cytidine kinase n=1 Tax=Acidobacterium capsulatum (strain ATCC 51196 / DSM 11244 / BCRC 80197 / JCM 7670 / NBRC 15755 / NCIMB 13165 / 161) TaxID=240015 RepID=C1F7J3_ACIC5|nr:MULTISPECIES: uridine kinase [Acidobacterium]ACO31314.1 putative uridine kinase [Acidobacterium capsulatum ATCC 51196]HCT59614.1 uridine kinase [Acidobacterium sp.]
MKPALILGVGGCSGSGKTTLARELARELKGVPFLLDHYYRDLSHLSYEERCVQNFDHPDAIETCLLIEQLEQLAASHTIAQPRYDFATHTRRAGVEERMEPAACIVVDGIFALYYPGLRRLYDLSVYVDAPDAVCYERRLARDIRERGRTPESVAGHYAATVRPMAERYVRPSSQYADLIVQGTESLDWSVERVMAEIGERGLV